MTGDGTHKSNCEKVTGIGGIFFRVREPEKIIVGAEESLNVQKAGQGTFLSLQKIS
jgi:hypothetical protein